VPLAPTIQQELETDRINDIACSSRSSVVAATFCCLLGGLRSSPAPGRPVSLGPLESGAVKGTPKA
jgi:hypothetical protein